MAAGPIIADPRACCEKVLLQRKTTRKRWFGADSVASSVVSEAAPRTTVRISDVVEAEDVQFVEEHHRFRLPCCSWSMLSPRKGKRSGSQLVLRHQRNSFKSQVRVLVVLHSKLPWRKVLRTEEQEEVTVIR